MDNNQPETKAVSLFAARRARGAQGTTPTPTPAQSGPDRSGPYLSEMQDQVGEQKIPPKVGVMEGGLPPEPAKNGDLSQRRFVAPVAKTPEVRRSDVKNAEGSSLAGQFSDPNRAIDFDQAFQEFMELVRSTLHPGTIDMVSVYGSAHQVALQILERDWPNHHPDLKDNMRKVIGRIQLSAAVIIFQGHIITGNEQKEGIRNVWTRGN